MLLSVFPIFGQNGDAKFADTLYFKGQLPVFLQISPKNDRPFQLGGRYIPQANYEMRFHKSRMVDFEASANLTSHFGFKASNPPAFNRQAKLYRAWARYSSRQFELRAGLQKINFGSA